MNWHIGQEIVCIKTHSEGVVKRGKIYTIRGLRNGICKCHNVLIDVGMSSSCLFMECDHCKEIGVTNGVRWYSENIFAPLEYNQDAINELLEQPMYVEK